MILFSAAITLALWLGGTNEAEEAQPSVDRFSFSTTVPTAAPAPASRVAPFVEPAGGLEAVESMLTARAAGDSATGWALLDEASRRRHPVSESWALAQTELPPPSSFTVVGSMASADRVDVTLRVSRVPAVDESVGFVPAEAVEVWRAVREGEGWRVSDAPVSSDPVLPPTADARGAAAEWLAARATGDARPLQLSSTLYGPGVLVESTSGAGWRVTGDAVAPAAGAADVSSLVAAFGPGIDAFLRLVPVAGPSGSAYVAAVPLGQSWLVTGVLSSTEPSP